MSAELLHISKRVRKVGSHFYWTLRCEQRISYTSAIINLAGFLEKGAISNVVIYTHRKAIFQPFYRLDFAVSAGENFSRNNSYLVEAAVRLPQQVIGCCACAPGF